MQSGVLTSRDWKDTQREKPLGFSEKPPEHCSFERNSICCKAASRVLLTVCGCSSSRREDLASSAFLLTVKILLHPDVYTRTLYHILTHHCLASIFLLSGGLECQCV